jgi:hypothetical protein
MEWAKVPYAYTNMHHIMMVWLDCTRPIQLGFDVSKLDVYNKHYWVIQG